MATTVNATRGWQIMKVKRWLWTGAGAGAGYLLGAKAGRERYQQMVNWSRRTAGDFGVSPAMDRVMGTAKGTAHEVRDAAAAKTHDVLDVGAQAVSDRIEAAGETLRP
jgi:hypothetical protein